jgi:hypothetical protein
MPRSLSSLAAASAEARYFLPEHGEAFTDSDACGEHELAEVDEIRLDSPLVLAEKFEPLFMFFVAWLYVVSAGRSRVVVDEHLPVRHVRLGRGGDSIV